MGQINYTDCVIDYVRGAKYEDFDEVTVLRAKERLIDSFGVMMIGRHADDTESIVNLFKRYKGAAESSVVTYKTKIPMPNAAFVNSLIMRAYDFEPIDAEPVIEGEENTAAHISGTTVPVVLAVSEFMNASGKDLLRALILADDVTARTLNASEFTVHDFFDGNGTANVFGSTTAAGLLLGLSHNQFHGAFSLGLNQMSGTMQNVFEKQSTFKFPLAFAAKAGVFAAQLSKCSFTPGLNDPIGGPRGYFDLFFTKPNPEKLLNRIGEKFVSDCVIKPWPACRATHASIDSALTALNNKKLSPEEILKVEVHVAPGVKSFVGEGFEFGMKESYEGAFSIDFLVATAILRGDILPEFFTPECMTDPELGKILEKIEIFGDLPASAGNFKARVEIRKKDGSLLSGETDMPKGEYYRTRFSRDDLLKKYYHNVDFGGTVSRNQADKIVSMIDNLETVDNAATLINLIA